MLLVFTANELERLAEKFSGKIIRLEFLGNNQFRVKTSGISVKVTLEEVLPRRITFAYKMNVFVNFFAEQFVNLDKPGIIWDKETDRFHLDFDKMPQDENTKDFFIKQMIMDEHKLIIDFDMYQPLDETSLQS